MGLRTFLWFFLKQFRMGILFSNFESRKAQWPVLRIFFYDFFYNFLFELYIWNCRWLRSGDLEFFFTKSESDSNYNLKLTLSKVYAWGLKLSLGLRIFFFWRNTLWSRRKMSRSNWLCGLRQSKLQWFLRLPDPGLTQFPESNEGLILRQGIALGHKRL